MKFVDLRKSFVFKLTQKISEKNVLLERFLEELYTKSVTN